MKSKNAFFLCAMLVMSNTAEAELLNELFYYTSKESNALLLHEAIEPLWSYPTTVMPTKIVPGACAVGFSGLNMRCDTAYYQLKFDSPDANTHAYCNYQLNFLYEAGRVKQTTFVMQSAHCQQDAAASLGCVIACEPLNTAGAGEQRIFYGLDVIIDEND